MPNRHLILPLVSHMLLAACEAGPESGDGAPPLLLVAEQGDLPTLEALLLDGHTPDVRDTYR